MNARQAANVERWAQEDAALAAAREWAEAKVAELAAEDAAEHARNLGPCLLCPTLRRQWSDLCDDCNDAFHDLAQLVQDNRTPAPVVVDQVPGQLELEEPAEAPEAVNLEVAGVVHLAGHFGIEGSANAVAVPACYSDTAKRRLVSRVREYGSFGTVDKTAEAVSCRRCKAGQ